MENYTQHITRTRIVIPRKRADLISRQRLLDALDELLDKKVIIIAAPAGYGKTSLLIDLADDLALPVCWYSLDALDQNISRFLEYFVASIQEKFPDFKTNIINVLHSSFQKEVDVDAMVTMLVNDIYDQITEHFVIMLDDYHLVVNDTQINQFLSRFLQNVEENCHIVFASRTLLALPDLPLMVARGLVGGLGFEELAFTTGETRELFFNNHHIVLSDTEAETLCKQTEGWITGLLLTAQTSITRLQAHEKSLRATGININDYFELIYNAQPKNIRQFLLYTSLLEDFNFDTVNQTVAKLFPDLGKQYKACADHIFKANLFVQSVGLDGLSLRYHHLFLDYLQQKVRLEQSETYEKLQDIIASHYRETQQWEKTYEIYRKEGQLEKQIALLEEAGASMMLSGQNGQLYIWLNEIPKEKILTRAGLCSLMGTILGTGGDLINSLDYLSQALNMLDPEHEAELTARTLTRKATTLRSMGHYAEALEVANKSLDIVKNNITLRSVRAETYRIIGTCYSEMGNPNLSIKNILLALEDYNFLQKENEIAVSSLNLGSAYFSLSQFENAKKYFMQVIQYCEKTNNHIWLATALNNMGVLQHIGGNIENAIMNFENALNYSRLTNYTRMEAVVLSGIGDIYTDLGAYDEAERIYHESLNIGNEIHTKYVIVYALYSLALLSIFQRNFSSSQEFINQVNPIIKEMNSPYDENLIQFAEGLLLFSTNNFLEAKPLFYNSMYFFQKNEYTSFIGRNALYSMLTGYLSSDYSCMEESYDILKNVLFIPDNEFVLLPSGLREIKIIEKIISEFPDKKDLKLWKKNIDEFKQKLPALKRRIRNKSNLVPFAPARLEIYTLGDTKVKFNEQWLSSSDWQTQSARDLFFLILSKPQGLTKEDIGIFLWPDDSEQDLKYHFKNAIYRLRHAIGKDSIMLDGDRYKFNQNLDFHYDVGDFRREIDSFNNCQDFEKKYIHYKKIVNIYMGDFLPTIDTEWILKEREILRNLYLSSILDMAQSSFKNEDFSLAIEISQKVLEYDPCQEEAYRIAMQSQAANGNRMEVEKLYKLCEKHLLEELAAPPSQKTKKLHHTLMRI